MTRRERRLARRLLGSQGLDFWQTLADLAADQRAGRDAGLVLLDPVCLAWLEDELAISPRKRREILRRISEVGLLEPVAHYRGRPVAARVLGIRSLKPEPKRPRRRAAEVVETADGGAPAHPTVTEKRHRDLQKSVTVDHATDTIPTDCERLEKKREEKRRNPLLPTPSEAGKPRATRPAATVVRGVSVSDSRPGSAALVNVTEADLQSLPELRRRFRIYTGAGRLEDTERRWLDWVSMAEHALADGRVPGAMFRRNVETGRWSAITDADEDAARERIRAAETPPTVGLGELLDRARAATALPSPRPAATVAPEPEAEPTPAELLAALRQEYETLDRLAREARGYDPAPYRERARRVRVEIHRLESEHAAVVAA